LKHSLAKTIAAKYHLGTIRKVYLRYGKNIKHRIPDTDKTIDFAKPNLSRSPKSFKGNTDFTDELRIVE